MASRAKRSPTRGGAKKQAIDPQLLCRQPPIVGRPPAIPPFLVRSGGKYRSIDVEVAQLGRDGRKYVTRDPRWFKVPNDDSAPRRLSKLERRITDSAKGTNTYYDLRQKELVRRLESAGRLDCQQELERLRGLHLKYTPSNRQLEDDYLRVNAGLEYSHWTPPLKKQEGLDRFDAYFYDKNIRVKESTAPALPRYAYSFDCLTSKADTIVAVLTKRKVSLQKTLILQMSLIGVTKSVRNDREQGNAWEEGF